MSNLLVHVVLDRSGSMNSIKDDTIGAFNSYVESLAKDSPDTILSLTIFDSQSVDTVINNQKVTEVTPLDRETYIPRASTPLYDAVGKVVTLLSEAKGESKALVILTDGQENCSKEYNKDAVKKLLDEKQSQGWLVIYLGANQDAFAEGAKFGTQSDYTMTFDTARIGSTMKSAASATNRYASAGGGLLGQSKAAFTDNERSSARTS